MFAVDKYDPTDDPELPKPGDTVPDGRTVAKAQYISAVDLTKMLMASEWPDIDGHADVLVKDHPTRPFVKYLVWVD